ncbi:MAG: glycoside hydrolase family 44 protein, partial [Blastocatellia bacterium]
MPKRLVSGNRLALLVLTFVLVALSIVVAVFAQNPAVTVNVNVSANRHQINPNIYGVAYPDAASLADLNVPIQRYGGNNASRYNWQINADNKDSDWFFESIGDDSATPAARIDDFVSLGLASNAQSLITIPTIGWVAKLGPSRAKLSSYSITKYGSQTSS